MAMRTVFVALRRVSLMVLNVALSEILVVREDLVFCPDGVWLNEHTLDRRDQNQLDHAIPGKKA